MKQRGAGIITSAIVLVLVGCVDSPQPPVPPGASVVASTVFVPQWTDDFYERVERHALGVVSGYLVASDTVTQDGGVDPSPMYQWVSPAWLPQELEGFTHYVAQQERTVGASLWDTPVVQLVRFTPEQIFDVGVMVCVDTTAVMVIPLGAEDPPEEVLTWLPHYDDFNGTEQEWAAVEEYFDAVPVRVGDRRTIVFWLVGETLDRLVVDSSEEWWGENQCSQ
jgi:hypothetical protein